MNINTIIIDCDGVLNDGKQPHRIEPGMYELRNTTGGTVVVQDRILQKAFKTFHSRDKTAIRWMAEEGFRVIIVSADDSEITKAWALSCGAEFIHERVKTLEGYGIDWERAAGIGDDIIDLPFLEKCKHAFCPADAHSVLLENHSIIHMRTMGGCGVIAEMSNIVQNYINV